jgi:hypothetical protein
MRLVSDIENGLPKTEAPSRSKSPTNWQAPPDRDRGPCKRGKSVGGAPYEAYRIRALT